MNICKLGTVVALVVALALSAVATASPAPTIHPHPNFSYWTKLHDCEQAGRWDHPGPTYQGGLGIWNGNWDNWSKHFKVNYVWPDAGDAPPRIQMVIANWAYYNWKDGNGQPPGWGCFKDVGKPY